MSKSYCQLNEKKKKWMNDYQNLWWSIFQEWSILYINLRVQGNGFPAVGSWGELGVIIHIESRATRQVSLDTTSQVSSQNLKALGLWVLSLIYYSTVNTHFSIQCGTSNSPRTCHNTQSQQSVDQSCRTRLF